MLNKHAQREAIRRPGCRVVSVNWGPWDGGMVTPSLRPLFASEGVGLIPPADGRALPRRRDPLVGRRPPGRGRRARRRFGRPVAAVEPVAAARPRRREAATNLTTVFERPLDPDALPILRSHVIDGRAVLPMALTLEWLAQGAIQRNPGLAFCGVDDLRLLKGAVVRDDEAETVAVLVGKAAKEPGGLFRVPVELRGILAGGRTVTHARGEVVLGDRPPQAGPAGDRRGRAAGLRAVAPGGLPRRPVPRPRPARPGADRGVYARGRSRPG